MTFTDTLFHLGRPFWEADLEHPFLRGIADGSLPPAAFARWIRQDAYYLQEYARIFALAAARAVDLDELRWYANALHLTVETEMALHRDLAARFQLSTDPLVPPDPWPTTRAYTDFLVRVAATGDRADLLAAMLPCEWSYVWLAQRLGEGPPSPEPRYAAWVEQYTSAVFQEVVDRMRADLDALAEPAPSPRKEALQHLFLVGCRYESAFWEMCWQGERWADPAR